MDERVTRRHSMQTRCRTGDNATIDQPEFVGYVHDDDARETAIGANATVRAGTIIYGDVDIGDNLTTGHHALIREDTTIGDDVTVGSQVVIDGDCTIGSKVSLQTGVYIPRGTTIGDYVFIGPAATLTNDPYPVRIDRTLMGPVLEEGVSIGANATILPDVTIGEQSFVAAGAVVTEDVPPGRLAVGVPAETTKLPEELQRLNIC